MGLGGVEGLGEMVDSFLTDVGVEVRDFSGLRDRARSVMPLAKEVSVSFA